MIIGEELADADTALTARVLAAAIRQMPGIDLVLCGEGSADLYFQQVGLQVGERLGLPAFNAVSGITLEGGVLVVERSLEDEVEVLEVPLPAVLQVTTDINQPRLPKMNDILKASKKPVREMAVGDLNLGDQAGGRIETLSTRAPHQVQRKQVVISGTPQEAAQALVGYLRKDGVI
jgi:electron transfer flavoprotein beta subunit